MNDFGRTRQVASLDQLGFDDLKLGDLIIFPDGRRMSVRATAAFPTPVGSASGFFLLGEFEGLLASPTRQGFPLLWYVRRPGLPSAGAPRCEGAVRYWAPHLPAVASAMGEVYYQTFEVPASVDPEIVVFRSKEPVRFVRAAYYDARGLTRLAMPSENEVIGDVRRESWAPRPDTREIEVETDTLWERFRRVTTT